MHCYFRLIQPLSLLPPIPAKGILIDSSFIAAVVDHTPPLKKKKTMFGHKLTPGIAVGINKGHKVTPREVAPRVSYRKGAKSQRATFVRSLVREVTGLAPYERRLIELIRNSQEKRARKLAKKKLGSFSRAKAKCEDMTNIIAESRRAAGH